MTLENQPESQSTDNVIESTDKPIDRTIPEVPLRGAALGDAIQKNRETGRFSDGPPIKVEDPNKQEPGGDSEDEGIIPVTGGELEDNPNVREAYKEVIKVIEEKYPHAVEKITSEQGRSVLLVKRYSKLVEDRIKSLKSSHPDKFEEFGKILPNVQENMVPRMVFTEEGFGGLTLTKDDLKTREHWDSTLFLKNKLMAKEITDAMKSARVGYTGGGSIQLNNEKYDIIVTARPLATNEPYRKEIGNILKTLEMVYGRNDEPADVTAETVLDGLI